MIDDLKYRALSQWWDVSSQLKKQMKTVSLTEKINNEKIIEAFRINLFNTLKQITETSVAQENWKENIIGQVKDLESRLSGYHLGIVDFFIENNYGGVTDEFIQQVREFDSKMDTYDMFQAIRNVWIMNSIQILYDMDVRLTPSIFAYSMLYPYSDNYLDDAGIPKQEKLEFNSRFRNWLLGENKEPVNDIEKHIYNLVKKIEGEFNRDTNIRVYESLLAIHKAQSLSLTQQRQKTLPYEKDILGISFEKGGTSVLADAYLVRGGLSEEERQFMFSYGVFLQIIDDLQDVEDDYNNQHMTILSQLSHEYKLDNLINKLMNFIDDLFNNETCFNSRRSVKLKQVIKDCSYIMILEAVSKNKKRFTEEYIRNIEDVSIVRFSYLNRIKKKFQKTFTSEDILKIAKILSK